MTGDGTRVAIFRPADERLEAGADRCREHGLTPISDPMLEIVPTGARPRTDAAHLIFTSKTAADILDGVDLTSNSATIWAIGPKTQAALEERGIGVDRVPETYTSAGLVTALESKVEGVRVEIARSDHGSQELLTGLHRAGAYVHETILYRLERPPEAGHSVQAAIDGKLDAVLFTSSLTVEHFMEIAAEREILDRVHDALDASLVATIGEPTKQTATEHGLAVDVVPESATFAALVEAVAERLGTAPHH